MGIYFIQQHTLKYCPDQRSFSWKGGRSWHSGSMKLCSLETIPPLSIVQIKVNLTMFLHNKQIFKKLIENFRLT